MNMTKFIKSVLIVIICSILVNGNNKKLRLCSSLNESEEIQLCAIHSGYQIDFTAVQPTITVVEVLDLSVKHKLLTLSLRVNLSWIDPSITLSKPLNNAVWFDINTQTTGHYELHWLKLKFDEQRKNHKVNLIGDVATDYQYFWFRPPHYFELVEYSTLKVGCYVLSTSYPFDNHECNVTFYAPDSESDYLEILPVVIEKDGTLFNSP